MSASGIGQQERHREIWLLPAYGRLPVPGGSRLWWTPLAQAVVHGGEHSVAGHGSTGNSVHTAGGTGLGQLVCQSFSSGAAQFGSLAGSIDLHTGHPAAGDGVHFERRWCSD